MKNKSFVNIIEAVVVIIALIAAFSIIFPSFSYISGWPEAFSVLKARDIILTADRIGNLYQYSYDVSALQNFLDILIPINETGMLSWSEMEGTLKNKIVIACNCTSDQMNNLTSWFNNLKINGRDIDVLQCYTDLEAINPCIRSSDVLLIWKYKDLSSSTYLNTLRTHLTNGNGIVEIMDFDASTTIDDTQKKIFGIGTGGAWGSPTEDIILKPSDASQITYQSYKLFYHLPLPLEAPYSAINNPPTCSRNTTGNFYIRESFYPFWICDGTEVYFDTDGDGVSDTTLNEGDSFSIQGFYFSLKYIEGNDRIRVLFNPNYNFTEFAKEPGLKKIIPIDGDTNRIFMRIDIFSPPPASVVIFNGTFAKTAWLADFSRDWSNVGDDQRNLLISVLLSTSSKRPIGVLLPEIKIGYKTSYINTVNDDMFEVYKFNLGLGHPFD